MKKLLFFLCFSLSITLSGIAQQIELNAGGGFSRYNLREVKSPTSISIYETFRHDPTWSVRAGINFKFALNENLSMGLGLNYAKVGNREFKDYSAAFPNSPDSSFRLVSNISEHLHYSGLSALIYFNKLHLFFGGQASYLWHATNKGHYKIYRFYKGNEIYAANVPFESTYELEKEDLFNRIDLGLTLGYEHKINSETKLTLSYYQGLHGVIKNNLAINYKNSQFLVGVSYIIKSEKKRN